LADRLFMAIVSGELQPGERLGEVRLARQLGVGQSTLREALQELEYRGLLTKKENRGTFVTSLTVELVEEIYAVRLELEPLAAALASSEMSGERILILHGLLKRMRNSGAAHKVNDFINYDEEFHRAIWRFSGNSALQRALNLICPPLFAFYLIHSRFTIQLESDLQLDADEHLKLIEALATRNPEQARTVFRNTLEDFRRRHIRHVRSLPSQPVAKNSLEDQSTTHAGADTQI
jgi:DNA-binding GntR family transcriptional regulator